MPVQVAPVKAVPLVDASEYVTVLKGRQSAQIQPLVEGNVTRILVTAGQQVSAGTALLEIDPSRQRAAVSSARAIRDANLASRDLAREQFERIRRLYAGGAATRQDFDQSEAALRQAEAGVASTEAQARAGTVELRYYRVVAPIAGTVGDIPVRVGDLVTTQTLLTTIDDNRALEAYVNIPLERAAEAHVGTEVDIVDAAGKVLAPSQVTFVSPRADPATQMVLLEATIDNRSGLLRSGQFARARVIWSRRNGPAVPVLAVQTRAGQSFVWLVRPGQNGALDAEPRPVSVGPIQGQNYPIVHGLEVGDRIVVSGVQKLRPGARVAPMADGAGPRGG
jgi:RND family efflux transporter MFP subunit